MQPTPVFLPGESHGQRSLVGYSPWGHKELDTTEQLDNHNSLCATLKRQTKRKRFSVNFYCWRQRTKGNKLKKKKERSYYLFSVKRRLQSKRRMLATDRNTPLYFLQLFLGKLPSWVKHNEILLHLQRLLIKLAAFLKDERNHSSFISAQCFWKDPGQRFTTKRCVFFFFFFIPQDVTQEKYGLG